MAVLFLFSNYQWAFGFCLKDYGDLRARYEDRALDAMKAQLASEAAAAGENFESDLRILPPAAKAKPPTPPRRGRPIRRGGRS